MRTLIERVLLPAYLAVLLVLILAARAVAAAETPAEEDEVVLELVFVHHVDMGMHEQDIFIEHDPDSGRVYRATREDLDPESPLFRVARPVRHEPFDLRQKGPYRNGGALNLKLGQWLSGSGDGEYRCEDGTGRIDVRFRSLVPDGVYTMWHWFVSIPPTVPFNGIYGVPLGDRDGSQSVFRADRRGDVRYVREFQPCLQLSGEHLASALAINWHSDGQTHGPLPGELSVDSHRHLLLFLPRRSGL